MKSKKASKPFKPKPIKPKPARPSSWNNFKLIYLSEYTITPVAAILSASYSQSNKRYKTNNVGYQGTANCIVAITMANMFEMKMWKEELMNKILDIGDKLHSVSAIRKNVKQQLLETRDIVSAFYISDTKVSLTVGDDLVGKLRVENDVRYDLKAGLDEFFKNNSYGVCTTQTVGAAFWKRDNYFYYFDPHDRDEIGKRVKECTGCACLMRFKSKGPMVDWFLGNLKNEQNSKFSLTPVKLLKMQTVDLSPPLTLEAQPPPAKLVTKQLSNEPPPVQKVEIKPKAPAKVLSSESIQETESALISEMNPAVEQAEETEETEKKEETSIEKELTAIAKVPSAMNISYYKNISDELGILRASTCTKPEVACASAKGAIVMLKFCKSKFWTTGILNDILKTGKILYKSSLLKTVGDRTLVLKDIINEFVINGKRYTTEVQPITVTGRLYSTKFEIPDLPMALKEFFVASDCGIIQGPLSVAIWQEDDLFYMFDPSERDARGFTIKPNRDIDEKGVACITWHKFSEKLSEFYLRNVDEANKNIPFIISKIEVKDYTPIADDWNNFKGLTENKWILRGEFNQNDLKFDKENRNSQCTSISAIAIAFTQLQCVSKWTSSTLNTVLMEGDHFYTRCVKFLESKERFQHPHLMVAELLPTHPFSSKAGKENIGKKIVFEIEDCLINGLINNDDNDEVFNLKRGLEKLFEDYKSGIVTTRNISVAVWKCDEAYLYFDSHSRDSKGLMTPFGKACLIRVVKISDLADSIKSNLSAGTEDQFNISVVEAIIQELDPTGGVKLPIFSDNRFLIHTNKLILRATHHEGDIILFHSNCNKQTLANCLVALGMGNVLPATSWSVVEIDEVLTIGNDLYVKSVEQRINSGRYDDYEGIKIEDLIRVFSIGIQKLSAILQDPVSIKPKKLLRELQKERKENCFIIDFGENAISVWIEEPTYCYIFDPKERDVYGDKLEKKRWIRPIPYDGGEEEGVGYDMMKYESPVGDEFFVAPSKSKDTMSTVAKSNVAESLLSFGEGEGDEDYKLDFDLPGKACLILFTDIKKLVNHILDNIHPDKEKEKFDIYPVLIETDFETRPEKPRALDEGEEAEVLAEDEEEPIDIDKYGGDWFNFKEVIVGWWIIRGSMNQENTCFPELNRGHQDASIAITAIVFKKIYEMQKWNSATVDAIIKYGDRLHTFTLKCVIKDMKANKALNLTPDEIHTIVEGTKFLPKQIYPEFHVGEYKYKTTIEEDKIEGDITAANDNEEVLSIKKGLQSYFESSKTCIINVKQKSIAIWRGLKAYYMFDPHPRGPRGKYSSVGVACITRYLQLNTLVDVLSSNMELEGSNKWTLDGVTITREISVEAERMAVPVPNNLPELCAFKEIEAGKNIVRASTSQNDEKFGPMKNAQYAANAVAALGMKVVHKTEIWTKAILDDVLNTANKLFAKTIYDLGYTFNPWEDKLTLNQIQNRYQIGIQRISCKYLNEFNIKGIIDTKTAMNLRIGCDKLFRDFTNGVIQTEELVLAVWKEDRNYYMFDPSPRNLTGMNMIADGTACLLSFCNVKMLSDHFTANISMTKRQGPFIITPVEITNTKEKVEDKKDDKKEDKKGEKKPDKKDDKKVEKKPDKRSDKKADDKKSTDAFKKIKGGDEILTGTLSQTSSLFSSRTRGFQATANSVIAIVMRFLVPLDKWVPRIIDTILQSGDQLYKDSFLYYKPDDFNIGLVNLLREFNVGKTHRVSIIIYKPSVSGSLIDFELESGLSNFFTYETDGVLTSEGISVAVFQKTGRYYMFDPYDRNDQGNVTYHGKACLVKFNDIRQLVTKFINNLNALQKPNTALFEISPITVTEIKRCN